MFDIIAMGETLIDFTPAGCEANGSPLFAQNPGGAPANVLAQAARLGAKTAFMGMVGKDGFGAFLRGIMQRSGIDTTGLLETDGAHTTLAFVQLDEQGDRSFSFYRKPGADVLLRPEDVDVSRIRDAHIFHFGSLSLTDEPIRSATHRAVEAAREAGCIISYDPNYRPPLWPSEAEAKAQMASMLPYVDVLKVSEEEMRLLTGDSNPETATKHFTELGISLVLVSMGEMGACYRCGDEFGHIPAFPVHAVDTNGAGDSFLGAILYCLRGKRREELRMMHSGELHELVTYGNAAGALTTTAYGAIPAMPDAGQIAGRLQKAAV